ncbi:cyb5r1 [Symbiodinium sp. CCMP2592]|nr:cyb5r1 [Symbiodinium sp. CCMP2592]
MLRVSSLLVVAAAHWPESRGPWFGDLGDLPSILGLATSKLSASTRMGACTLISKSTICDDTGRGEPVQRLVFQPSVGNCMNINTALRQVVMVRGRMYSPTPCRVDNTFDLIIRVYRNGTVSRWLDSVTPGTAVELTPFPPKLPANRRNPGPRVGLVAYGVGITELYWTAVEELKDPKVEQVVLLYATRTLDEQAVYGPELDELAQKEPRFRLVRLLSRECSPVALSGRVNATLLSDVFPWSHEQWRSTARFTAAGSKEMMTATYEWLAELGYPPDSSKLIRDLSFASFFGSR